MKKSVILFLSFWVMLCTYAQVGINEDESDPDPSAMLDVKSDDKGFLPPRLTNIQRDAIPSPTAGLMIFNSDDNNFQVYDGTNWEGLYWKQKEDAVFVKAAVIIGDSTGSENSQLTLISSYNSSGGGGYGLLSRHSTDHTYLKFNSKSTVGYSSLWHTQAQCGAIHGKLYLNKDNSSSYDSHTGAGHFVLRFEDYSPYNYSNNIHFLGGSYCEIIGEIANYPQFSAIAAVIGNDRIQNDKTFAGYFRGRGYFSDNLGIGTDSPKTKVEVAEGDVYISNIDNGIIMKSPDGGCWKGTLDNSGNLNFISIECP